MKQVLMISVLVIAAAWGLGCVPVDWGNDGCDDETCSGDYDAGDDHDAQSGTDQKSDGGRRKADAGKIPSDVEDSGDDDISDTGDDF